LFVGVWKIGSFSKICVYSFPKYLCNLPTYFWQFYNIYFHNFPAYFLIRRTLRNIENKYWVWDFLIFANGKLDFFHWNIAVFHKEAFAEIRPARGQQSRAAGQGSRAGQGRAGQGRAGRAGQEGQGRAGQQGRARQAGQQASQRDSQLSSQPVSQPACPMVGQFKGDAP
jgi:hypothetical protein